MGLTPVEQKQIAMAQKANHQFFTVHDALRATQRRLEATQRQVRRLENRLTRLETAESDPVFPPPPTRNPIFHLRATQPANRNQEILQSINHRRDIQSFGYVPF